MARRPPASRTNQSLFIGLWLGLTVVVGICVFLALLWGLGGFPAQAEASPTARVATAPPATLPASPATSSPLPESPTATGEVGGGPACSFRPERASGFAYGVQSHVFVGDPKDWMGVISDKLNFDWVKMQVRWHDLQSTPGPIFWDVLDGAVNEACAHGLRTLMSVVAAPEWTRANSLPAPEGQEAPPDDPQAYADFLAALIDRYPGRIGAIEVWNEENLEREWNTAAGVNPADYVKLLKAAYTAIKAKDPSIIVILGALSPTGINCNVSFPDCQPNGRPIVMDDAAYLRGLIEAEALDYADCIGTHSNGTNLPPTADGAHPPPQAGYTFTGPWDNPHYSWALKSQVETYAALLNGRMLQCVTEFGYAAPVDGKYPPNFGFAADVTEAKQAEYLVAAFDWMRTSGQVKMAFLFNLDYGPKGGDPATDDNVIFSLINKQGIGRPAFDALNVMPKP